MPGTAKKQEPSITSQIEVLRGRIASLGEKNCDANATITGRKRPRQRDV